MSGMLIDVSQHDMSTWNPQCFKAAGVTAAITNSFNRGGGAQRITSLREAGIPVIGVYGFCYFGPDPWYVNRDVDAAIDLAIQFDIPMVWVDAEADANSIDGLEYLRPSFPDERKVQLRQQINKVLAAGLNVGIYTAAWWWPSKMAGAVEWGHLPLWHADYGANDGTKPPVTHVNYGGWSRVAIHQYTSTKPLCGRGRDHNYLLDTAVAGGSPEEEDMTPEQVEAIVKRMVYGSEERYDYLHGPEVGQRPLEDRVNDMERDDGWLVKRLAALEASPPGEGIGSGARVNIIGTIEEVTK